MRRRVLFIIIATALAVAADTVRAQDSLPDTSGSADRAEYATIELEEPRVLAPLRFERSEGRSLVTTGSLTFEHRRDRDDSPDGRRTRFERLYLDGDDGSSVRWALWRSGDRQDYHGGLKYKALGIAITIAF